MHYPVIEFQDRCRPRGPCVRSLPEQSSSHRLKELRMSVSDDARSGHDMRQTRLVARESHARRPLVSNFSSGRSRTPCLVRHLSRRTCYPSSRCVPPARPQAVPRTGWQQNGEARTIGGVQMLTSSSSARSMIVVAALNVVGCPISSS